MRFFFLILAAALLPRTAYCDFSVLWGDMGHRIVAQNPIDLLDPELKALFASHTSEFAYYANVPDTVWKLHRLIESQESPTHYFNAENFSLSPASPEFPTEFSKAKLLFTPPAGRIDPTFEGNGTAPWRALQFMGLLTKSFERKGAGKAVSMEPGLLAGLMTHYAGDIAQPFHGTNDFDGQLSGHKGIHSYFESHVVDELALRDQLAVKSLKIAKENQAVWRQKFKVENPVRMALDVLMDGHSMIPGIYAIDTQHALKNLSRLAAVPRHPAEKTAQFFAPIVEQRIALGSFFVAELINKAWAMAGKPKLESVFGAFIRRPAFIKPLF